MFQGRDGLDDFINCEVENVFLEVVSQMEFKLQNNSVKHFRSYNFSDLAKRFSSILSDFELSLFHESTNFGEDLLELKEEHFHGELDKHFGDGDRNHHSASVFLFFGFLVGFIFVEEHEFQRDEDVHFEEIDQGR